MGCLGKGLEFDHEEIVDKQDCKGQVWIICVETGGF